MNDFLKKIFSLYLCAFFLTAFQASNFFGEEFSPENEETISREFFMYHPALDMNLNPHTSAYVFEAQILNSIYEGLFSYNPATLEADCALAKEYRISRDKLRWTFTIREGAKSSKGCPIDAQTVKNSWLDLIANKDAYYSSLLDVIKGAREYRLGTGKREDVAISIFADKLSVELVKPTSHLNKILCHHAFCAIPKDGGTSGAFFIEENSEKRIVLKKNPNYWNENEVQIPKVTIVFFDDAEEAVFAFNTGTADWISGTGEVAKILDKDAIQLSAEFGTEYLFFKNKNDIWSKKEFRNAILCAVPWNELRAQSMFPATTLVCPSNGYASPEGLDYCDAEEAKIMLGAAKKKFGISTKTLALSFAIPDTEYMENRARLLQDALSKIQVEVKLVKIPAANYLSSIKNTNADLFLYTWIGDFSDPLAFLELFRSDSSMNDSLWKNSEFDKLLDQAMFTNDAREHNIFLARAEDILLSHGVVIPISHPVSCNIIDLKTTGGWYINAMDIHPFKNIFIKKSGIEFKNVVIKNTK